MNLKYYSFFFFLFVLVPSTFAFDIQSECEERTFVVTAYYSPLDNQDFYYKSNSVEEKILNGNGIAGAGGKKVFNGMLAAPSSYDFGSLVYFPGLGIGEIADRGGAIVHAGERGHHSDRIDIWMGKGEEGLVRALTFGKQTLTGYFCDNDIVKNHKIQIGFDMKKIPIYENFFDIALWVVNLQEGRSDIWVSTLQKYLIKLGFLKEGRQTGFFGKETKKALCDYQVAKGLSYRSSKYCGNFSTSTSFRMKEDIKNKGFFPADLWEEGDINSLKKIAKNYLSNEIVSVYSEQYFTYPFKKGDKSDDIKKLQTILTNLSYYTGDIDGVFDGRTISAVYDFQLKNKILSSDDKNMSSRGWLGPSTRNKLNGLVSDNEELLVLKENNVPLKQDSIYSDSGLLTGQAGSSSTITPKGQSSEKKKEQKGKVFQFYRAFKKGDQNREIRILQNFLSGENLYKGKIDGIYSVSVINALCEFQKKNSLWFNGDSISLCGYLGPKTREIINGKL